MDNYSTTHSSVSLNNPVSRLALTVAKILLRFNVFCIEFIELLRYHLVMELSKQDPKASMVEISARTGLDRRTISKIVNADEQKKPKPKVEEVLKRVRQVCLSNESDQIGKRAFQQICQQTCSGSLTAAAVAKELLRQGHLFDEGKQYRVNISPESSVNDVIDFYYLSRRVLNEFHAYCLQHKTDGIKKAGKVNSFEQIVLDTCGDQCSVDDMANYLIKTGNIYLNGDHYLFKKWRYTNKNQSTHFILMTREINRLVATIIHNIDSDDASIKRLQRTAYSSQIDPEKFTKLTQLAKDLFERPIDELFDLLWSMQSDVERNTYPKVGVSLYFFQDESVDLMA